ncbi:MAG: hypothetical protein AAFQ22_08500 [Pseudomonadota bacterium]
MIETGFIVSVLPVWPEGDCFATPLLTTYSSNQLYIQEIDKYDRVAAFTNVSTKADLSAQIITPSRNLVKRGDDACYAYIYSNSDVIVGNRKDLSIKLMAGSQINDAAHEVNGHEIEMFVGANPNVEKPDIFSEQDAEKVGHILSASIAAEAQAVSLLFSNSMLAKQRADRKHASMQIMSLAMSDNMSISELYRRFDRFSSTSKKKFRSILDDLSHIGFIELTRFEGKRETAVILSPQAQARMLEYAKSKEKIYMLELQKLENVFSSEPTSQFLSSSGRN